MSIYNVSVSCKKRLKKVSNWMIERVLYKEVDFGLLRANEIWLDGRKGMKNYLLQKLHNFFDGK